MEINVHLWRGWKRSFKKFGSCRSFAIESSSSHPHKAIDFQTLRDNISGNIFGTLLNSTQAAFHSLAEKVVLLVCSVISLYANKYSTLRPVLYAREQKEILTKSQKGKLYFFVISTIDRSLGTYIFSSWTCF